MKGMRADLSQIAVSSIQVFDDYVLNTCMTKELFPYGRRDNRRRYQTSSD